MSDGGAVTRVLETLERAGYERIAQPLDVGGIPFSFVATLVRKDSLDLVIVIDTIAEADESRVREHVEGLSRAMDVVGSRRAVTVIAVGPRPSLTLWNALWGVARVLAVADGDQTTTDTELEDSLAVLLPLSLATESDAVPLSWAIVRDELVKKHKTAEMEALITSATDGAPSVQHQIHEILLGALEPS
jgi:hypothetical protein